MKNVFFAFWGVVFFISCTNSKSITKYEQPELKNSYDSASYAWGLNIADFLKDYYYSSLDAELMVAAFNQSLKGEPVLFSPEQVKEIVRVYGETLLDSVYNRNDLAGKKYLQENAEKPNVKILDSGVQFEVISSGWGDKYPIPGDRLIVHYDCFTLDGKKVDSSIDRMEPYEFVIGIGSVIRGWEEIGYKMKEGDKFRVVIPAASAYDRSLSIHGIPPGSTLVYEIKLIELKAINTQN